MLNRDSLTSGFSAKSIDRREKKTSGGIETDDPSEGKYVVNYSQDNRNLCDHNSRSHDGLNESVALMAALPLLNTNDSQKAGLAFRLLVLRDLAVVVGLIHEGDD